MIGTSISHYRIISHIGAGGMGTVYLAEDANLSRRVALKFLPPETASNPEAAARLLREARAASALDHPNIATIYEIGNDQGRPFIAMAHYEGETLAARLARGQLPMAEIAGIVAQIADALKAAHAASIVHRDLKPSNLMLTTTGQLKVLDFGLAKIESGETATQLTRAGSTVGTAAYMSPEQAGGDVVDARSDLWSLGVVTHEMLAGRLTFDGPNALAVIHAVLTTAPAPVKTVRPDVAPELEDLSIGRSCAPAIGARLQRPRCEISHRPATRDYRQDHSLRRAAADVAAHAACGRGRRARRPRGWRRMVGAAQLEGSLGAAGGAAGDHRLAGADKFDEAYRLALQAQRFIPDDRLLAEQMRGISRRRRSTPIRLARSLLPPVRPERRAVASARQDSDRRRSVPRGLLHWRAQLAGRETAEDVGPGPSDEPRIHFTLFPENQVPAGMVRIASAGQPFRVFIPGLEHLPEVNLPDYWIDRHEVTNRAFKRFVDDGGYRRAELWREPFLKDGRH